MEPTAAKPLTKRRRWLIVAFVLVLVSLVSWWYWPRGDARFVGKWRFVEDSHPHDNTTIRFWRNGEFQFYVNGEAKETSASWWVDNETLCFQTSYSLGAEGIKERLSNLRYRLVGDSTFTSGICFTIVSVSPANIRLHYHDEVTGQEVAPTLTRIPE